MQFTLLKRVILLTFSRRPQCCSNTKNKSFIYLLTFSPNLWSDRRCLTNDSHKLTDCVNISSLAVVITAALIKWKLADNWKISSHFFSAGQCKVRWAWPASRAQSATPELVKGPPLWSHHFSNLAARTRWLTWSWFENNSLCWSSEWSLRIPCSARGTLAANLFYWLVCPISISVYYLLSLIVALLNDWQRRAAANLIKIMELRLEGCPNSSLHPYLKVNLGFQFQKLIEWNHC